MENKKTNYDLSIIIVSWNVRDKLRENLKAIYDSVETRPSNSAGRHGASVCKFEVFVVDNNSADKSAQIVKQEFPQVRLIANNENLGFAKANNQAIKMARGEFALLLNPDMRVRPDTLSNMITWMRENKQASAAGCHLVDELGNTVKQVRRFPTIWDQLAIVLKLPHLFPGILNKYIRVDFDYSQPAKVDSIRGGFMIFRLEAIHESLLDERYFLWFEEVDFCQQIRQNHGEVWYTPAAECVDYVGQSFAQVGNIKKQKYFRDSMLEYFKKWHPVWQYWILKLAWPAGMFITWIFVKLNVKSKNRT